jgi:tetratricopeptide (TPR) repeat protein
MSLDNLKTLDVTLSMKGTANAINEVMGQLGDGKSAADREILTVINNKLLEVDEAFDRPLDSPEVFVKLKDIARNAGNRELEAYCQNRVNMLKANDLHFKGYTWLYFGDCVNAIKYLKEAAELAPNHPVAGIDLKKAEKRLAKADDEIIKAEIQIDRNPGRADAWLKKANAMVIKGQLEEALAVYDRVLELDPQNVSAMGKKGAALEGLGRFDEAIPLFEAALEIKPKSQIAKKGLNLAEYFEENPDFSV